MFTITFQDRETFQPLAERRGLGWQVQRLEWRAVGGPWQARLRATGALSDLWSLPDLLRCGVRISDALGPAWCGYVDGLTLHAGARTISIHLAEMANRVSARYRVVAPNGAGSGYSYTPWQEDAASQRVYGVKERMLTLDHALTAEAQAAVSAALRETAWPRFCADSAGDPGGDPGQPWAELDCRGWWRTLDWRLYSQPRGLLSNEKGASLYNLGSGANIAYAASFSMPDPPWRIGEVWVKLRRVKTPAATLGARIWLDAAGQPGAAAADSLPLSAADLDEELAWTRFTFDPPYLPAAGAALWIGVRNLGGTNAASYYQLGLDQGLSAEGSTLINNGSGWGALSPDADLARMIVGVEDTGAQAAAMLGPSAGGQFLRAVRLETESGILGRLYRDGSRRTGEEVEALLAAGTASGQRLLAAITPERAARIYPQPAVSDPDVPGSGLLIDADGQICRDDGQPLPLSTGPAGRWARLGPLTNPAFAIPGPVSPAQPQAAARIFIESAVWQGGLLKMGPG